MTNEIGVAVLLPDHDRSIATDPVSVAATIALHRRLCRLPSPKNSHAKYLRGLPSRARPARTPRETGFPPRTKVMHRFVRV
ncbi:hypothetical protein [Burkholderia cepacia]|uniref:hypothetical protein n=1 Tax=Burkholderia cepacia TaxID=292 RepID=UPI00398F5B11